MTIKLYNLQGQTKVPKTFLVSGWRVNVAEMQPFLDACTHFPVSNQSFCRIGSRLTMTVTRNQMLLSRGDRTMVSEFSKRSKTRRHLYPTPFCSSLRYVLHADFAKSQKETDPSFVFPLQTLVRQFSALCTTHPGALAVDSKANGTAQHNRCKLDHAPNETTTQHICYVARLDTSGYT
jgi:hypothetical protein